jgi:LemA protein
MWAYIVIGLVILTIIWIVYSYNNLIRLKNAVNQAWAAIDVQIKRRSDLIPNVTKVVATYATHEKKLLVEIGQLRAKMIAQSQSSETLKLDTRLSASVKHLFAVVENYPKLQADKNFLELQKELSNTENQIAASRRIYSENVAICDTAIESFPSNIVASACGFVKGGPYIL